ncbi:hypothetical protein SRHO_G00190020 [Serrasalmus rhombeus]
MRDSLHKKYAFGSDLEGNPDVARSATAENRHGSHGRNDGGGETSIAAQCGLAKTGQSYGPPPSKPHQRAIPASIHTNPGHLQSLAQRSMFKCMMLEEMWKVGYLWVHDILPAEMPPAAHWQSARMATHYGRSEGL